MTLSWISITSKLQTGISLINSVNASKFALLLQHIIRAKSDSIFTSEKMQKLEETFGLNPNNIQLLIQCVIYIIKQSSKVMLKPTVLQKQLVDDLKMDSDKAQEFMKVWTNKAKEDFDNLENIQKLEQIAWELNLQTSSSLTGAKETLPNVRVKLELCDTKSSKHENVVFELNEDELLRMYNMLETIQNKLDFIQSTFE